MESLAGKPFATVVEHRRRCNADMSVGVEKKRGRCVIGNGERAQHVRTIMKRCDEWINRDHFLANALREVESGTGRNPRPASASPHAEFLDARKVDNDRVAT
jgi:hypothetical protein